FQGDARMPRTPDAAAAHREATTTPSSLAPCPRRSGRSSGRHETARLPGEGRRCSSLRGGWRLSYRLVQRAGLAYMQLYGVSAWRQPNIGCIVVPVYLVGRQCKSWSTFGGRAMPDLFEIMESCRAMRRLKPDPVPDELVAKILRAGIYAPNGGNTLKWRFLVVKDPKIKKAVQVIYKKAYDEVIGPRYSSSEPPPGSDKRKYRGQHAAVEYLTEHYHEAPVWIVACLEDGATPNRMAGSSIYPAVQNMVLATRALGLGTTLTTRHMLFEKEADAALGLPPG